ncbi:RNA ligase family protein [Ureibacillus chungkukjangi]|uniref:RNA ligase family protein n=1 Tax=Ureibacillus chungkukjangi TaxID=1202712 RepID=UPI0020424839|nr:RNA ligase family protein [Ureibacillus chungkukjangi]MCM3387257.1 RNA ligase family protein [Ureibacillus chungkukjangi]
MEFKRYQHLERFGTDEVQDIEFGDTLIFPKLDGTNASVWLDNEGNIKGGSRNRQLTLENDNAGFYAYVVENEKLKGYLAKYPTHRLYGEWLVPHSLKTYRDDAWRKFYIFDITIDKEDDSVEYIPYDIYKPLLDEFDLDYIVPIAKVKNGSYDTYLKALEKNQFLIKDGQGNGEGIVIKNYDFYNRFGRQNWAKIVTTEFKEKHAKAMGYNEIKNKMVEESIVEEFCTSAFIEKEYSKIVHENEGWQSKLIPMLLGRVWHEFIKEESWNFIKQFKNPKVDYKTLNALVTRKIKEVKSEIFS